MARFILLRVEDNDEAAQIVESIRKNDAWDGGGFSSVDVFGLYPLPTVFCTCENDEGTRAQGGKRITRGAKLGWWVHRKCGRPTRGSWQSPHNLLDPVEVHRARPIGDPNWKDPEFMFNPKLTWTHSRQSASETGEVAPPTDDAQATSE